MRKRIIVILTIILILVGAGTLVGIRWNVWFGNSPEADYVVPQKPHNIVLSYGEKAASMRTIAWRADTVVKPSCVKLISEQDTALFPAQAALLHTRAGKAAFYKVFLPPLTEGNYQYCCLSGEEQSDIRHFIIHPDEGNRFLLFGDVQDKLGQSSPLLFSTAFSSHPDAHYAAFVGDIIERPTDIYYQLFFRSLRGQQEYIPLLASTGNHEYLKGVVKHLDNRWKKVFVNPQNGPKRTLGSTYYVDFPEYRMIVLDTDALHLFSDFTITQTWLSGALREAQQKWKIVIMHHPVYSAGKGRSNPLFYTFFHATLREADIVFCGHDHNYLRRGDKPVYLLTNSSDKFYQPKQHIHADKHAAYTRLYEYVTVTTDSLRIETYEAESDSLFDSITLHRP